MAFSWLVYTSLSAKKALELEKRLSLALEELLASRKDLVKKGGEWGEVTVEDAVPSSDDVAELSEAYGRDVSEDVLDRLDECRSALSVDRNGVSDIDPLQVSILRWILHEVGPCLIDWGDFQIVRSEDVAADMANYQSAGPLGGIGGDEPPPAVEAAPGEAPAAPSQEGLERAAETTHAIDAVKEDPFLKRRFLRTLEKYPEFVKNYVKILGERGAIPDATAAQELGVPVAKLAPHLEKLHDETLDLADEADDPDED